MKSRLADVIAGTTDVDDNDITLTLLNIDGLSGTWQVRQCES